MQNQAAEIKLRAERQAGKLLNDVPRIPRIENITPNRHDDDSENKGYLQVLKENDLSEPTARRWQLVATEISDEEFDEYIEQTKAKKAELTSANLHYRFNVC